MWNSDRDTKGKYRGICASCGRTWTDRDINLEIQTIMQEDEESLHTIQQTLISMRDALTERDKMIESITDTNIHLTLRLNHILTVLETHKFITPDELRRLHHICFDD